MPKSASPAGSTVVRVPSVFRRPGRAGGPERGRTIVPWLGAVVLGSASAVLLGWLAVAAVISVAWLTARSLAPAVMLDAMSQAWLGVHGVPFRLGGNVFDLTPLGAALLVVAAMSLVVRFALGFTGPAQGGPLRRAGAVAGACTLTYALLTLLLGTLVGTTPQAAAAAGGGFVLAGLGSLLGLSLEARTLLRSAPAWVRALPRAVGAGLTALTLLGVAALATAVVAHWPRVRAAQAALAPDAAGNVLLGVTYLAYLPNLILWAASYALGAGISVGAGTLVTPFRSVLGAVPTLPPAAALPVVPPRFGWLWCTGALWAGLAIAAAYTRTLRRAGAPNWRTWAGGSGLAGLIAGLAWTLASWFSRGDLGTGRLVGMGPRFPDLAVLGVLPVAAAAALGGALAALVAGRPRRARVSAAEPRDEPDGGATATSPERTPDAAVAATKAEPDAAWTDPTAGREDAAVVEPTEVLEPSEPVDPTVRGRLRAAQPDVPAPAPEPDAAPPAHRPFGLDDEDAEHEHDEDAGAAPTPPAEAEERRPFGLD